MLCLPPGLGGNSKKEEEWGKKENRRYPGGYPGDIKPML
jgi:hypothetical protein